MPNARLANAGDLDALLALFAASDVSRSAEPAERIWPRRWRARGLPCSCPMRTLGSSRPAC